MGVVFRVGLVSKFMRRNVFFSCSLLLNSDTCVTSVVQSLLNLTAWLRLQKTTQTNINNRPAAKYKYPTTIDSNCVVGSKMGTPTVAHCINGSGGVTAVALLDTQLFVTRNGVAQVSIYDKSSLELQRQLSISGLSTSPWGLATCSTNNNLYVSDYVNSCIHRVDVSVSSSNIVAKWNVANKPRGLSVNGARNVLVAYYELKMVQEYTPDGSLVRQIADGNSLWQAVELHSGKLVISRFGPVHGIATMTMNGQVSQSFGNQPGSGNGQMNNPRCFIVDKGGYILVADYSNNRILVVNSYLTDARTLPLSVDTALQTPFATCLDQSRRRLYVGEWGGQKRLLVFDHVFNVGSMFDK